MNTFYNDLFEIIKETIIENHLENMKLQQLLDLDIIEYIFLIISQLYDVNYCDTEEIILNYLKVVLCVNNKKSLYKNILNEFKNINYDIFKSQYEDFEDKFKLFKDDIKKELDKDDIKKKNR